MVARSRNMRSTSVLILLASLAVGAEAQVLCVQCFEQNDSIGVNVGAGNLVVNGGFENTTCATGCAGVYCPSAMSFNCSIANWTCTGGGTLTYACVYDSAQYMVVEKARAAYFGNSYANPCSGPITGPFPNNDTSCFVQSGCQVFMQGSGYPISGPSHGGTTGISLAQTVTGLVPGNIYVLEFWAGGEYQGWFSTNGLFAVDVGFGRIFLRCKVTQQLPDTGTRYLIQFMAASSAHTIRFTNWGHVCGSCTEVVIDDVRLYEQGYLPSTVPLCSTGIDDQKVQGVKVSLDAGGSALNVRVGSNGPSMILISDHLGRNVIDRTFTTATTIDIASLAAGVYLYAINGEGVISTGRFTKE